ncbi:TPA: DUF1329 domain-containing protein [Pseudomonas aeruginosa]
MNNFKQWKIALLVSAVISCSSVNGAVSQEEAVRLGNDLTPFGGIKAGNEEGTIPAWTGGLTSGPQGYAHKSGDFLPNPFVDEKPLFAITAQNLGQYADKLSAGQRALLKKYPDSYRLDIYPTHRTHAVPEWVARNIRQNAIKAKLVDGGNGIEGAYGGVPFPIPSSGEEVMWNHLLRWQGGDSEYRYNALVVQPNGTISSGESIAVEQSAFYLPGGSVETFGGDYFSLLVNYLAPARRKGEVLLIVDPINQVKNPRNAWLYLPGQRRVRRAPTVAYDTPNPNFNGVATYDDTYMFYGALDRYNWKLVGKRELYVPYNNYKQDSPARYTEVMKGGHTNPNYGRWELHRVWEVEATLKDGSRHVYGKRTFYVDEDSWLVVLSDSYDGRGNLWRTNTMHSLAYWTAPGVMRGSFVHYDLVSGVYGVNVAVNEQAKAIVFTEPRKAEFFTPASLRRQSLR